MGYEMYRLLSSKKVHLQKTPKNRKKTPGSDVIDVEEVDRDKNLLVGQLSDSITALNLTLALLNKLRCHAHF